MTPLDWVRAFAVFAQVAPELVDAFAAKHPELSEGPPKDSQADLWEKFQADLADKFPADDDDG